MDWFKITTLEPPKKLKNTFNCDVIQKIKDGTAITKFNFNRVLKQVPKNEITKKVSETKNYSEKVEAVLKLEMLHYTKKQFEDLTEYCSIRSRYISDEIYKIEQKYIEPTYIYYGPISYPKRTYVVGGENYTTYKGETQYNTKFFAAIATLIVSSMIFG